MPAQSPSSSKRVLVTGATGYIGGRLVPCLLEKGYTVRCFVRDATRLEGQPWADRVEVVEGDALEYDTVEPAMDEVYAVYYLIHSLGSGDDFADRDRKAANNFGKAAEQAGVERIVYLGGIKPKGDQLSEHLESRMETGDHLRNWSVPVTELRAAVVVGSGSLSFELVRYLTERVPIMICPVWVHTPTQPIAVRDVLQYLAATIETSETAGEIIEIGGTDVLTYGDMFRIYAKVRDLNRPIINVPFLTPRLSSHWVGLVTPISNQVARPLIEGLDNEVTVDHPERARHFFPDIEPISYEAAVRLALHRVHSGDVPTVWNSALSSTPESREMLQDLEITEGLFKETRQITVSPSPETTFDLIKQLGGETGWLYGDALWHLRGYLDQLMGGPGFRRGRRNPNDLRVGDAVDFWRVEDLEEGRLLRLRAEMKLPGRAWLQYEVFPTESPHDNATRVVQTVFFEPKGLLGTLYWYLVAFVHRLIYAGMIEALGERAEQVANSEPQRHASDRVPESVG